MALKELGREVDPHLDERGFGPRVSGDPKLRGMNDHNRPTLRGMREGFRRLPLPVKIGLGILETAAVVLAGDSLLAKTTGIDLIHGVGVTPTPDAPHTIDPTKCFTVPGTEDRPLDVCVVDFTK